MDYNVHVTVGRSSTSARVTAHSTLLASAWGKDPAEAVSNAMQRALRSEVQTSAILTMLAEMSDAERDRILTELQMWKSQER